jgi:hypothetical protein
MSAQMSAKYRARKRYLANFTGFRHVARRKQGSRIAVGKKVLSILQEVD